MVSLISSRRLGLYVRRPLARLEMSTPVASQTEKVPHGYL